MNQKERNALDRHITGNYGEDRFRYPAHTCADRPNLPCDACDGPPVRDVAGPCNYPLHTCVDRPSLQCEACERAVAEDQALALRYLRNGTRPPRAPASRADWLLAAGLCAAAVAFALIRWFLW